VRLQRREALPPVIKADRVGGIAVAAAAELVITEGGEDVDVLRRPGLRVAPKGRIVRSIAALVDQVAADEDRRRMLIGDPLDQSLAGWRVSP